MFVISDNDHGGYVAVASYTFVVLMVLLVLTRVFTRWYVVKVVKADDILLIIAAVSKRRWDSPGYAKGPSS